MCRKKGINWKWDGNDIRREGEERKERIKGANSKNENKKQECEWRWRKKEEGKESQREMHRKIEGGKIKRDKSKIKRDKSKKKKLKRKI